MESGYLKQKRRIEFDHNASSMTHSRTSSNLNPHTGKNYSENYLEILEKRKLLPAWEAKSQLIELLQENQVIILQGETGSGKTTQVPQFLVDAGYVSSRFNNS